MDRRTNVILAIIITMIILPTCAQAIPIPHGVAGTVYRSNGATQVSVGASFSVSGTTSGDYIEGTTGAGPFSGAYSVSIDGNDGDTVIVKAWNATHYGERTVILAGDMTGIDVVINKTLPSTTSTPTPVHIRSGGGVAPPKVTPTATLAATTPEGTPIVTPTPTTAPMPKPIREIPGFEALFVIPGLLAVVYLLKSCEGGK